MIEFVAVGSVIIDDIVDPQGRSRMGVLGGGGTYAISGMRVWSDNVALVSVIGEGFPKSAWAQLRGLTDTRGIIRRAVPQPRSWQLFEADGTRHEVFRTDFDEFLRIPVQPAEYPAEFAPARGVYLQAPTAASARAWATRLKQMNPNTALLWEPWEIFYTPDNLADFRQVARLFEIVSPNTAEAEWLLQETDPARQVEMLFECGVRCVALRMGAEGSLVGTRGQVHHIPAISVTVVDETGAGNSYCGGFVVGYVESGGDPYAAGQYGAISATVALSQVGVEDAGVNPFLP